MILYAVAVLVGLGLLGLSSSIRVVTQFERGVVFRFGRVQPAVRGPGLMLLIPIADRLEKVNMQIITMPVPAQDGITRDNVTVRVDAVVYFNVADPVRVAVDVQDYVSAIGQVAQTSLRSIIGKSELDDLLSNREGLNQGLELMIDSPALGWGVQIDRVEIKDVVLPDSMKRSMSRQAEAERERRAPHHHRRRRTASLGEIGPGRRDHDGTSRRPTTTAPANRRGSRGREELDAGAAVPGRVAPLSGASDTADRPCSDANSRTYNHTHSGQRKR
ncbi:stomatin family protein [Rhodococcus wratislaviensis IFP 2016]|nr:stomatin family protein [Rhodococcus wratislaviensis IFP 2016]